ncbi:MAG TPA: DUF805 domain-containing protein [Steroidobacteraceae bacterium]|nr:DUF805 domain-containing protein [Steroidobacteraceae bacterium]
MKALVLAGRLLFGAWMLLYGAAHFFALVHAPAGHEPLAIQLMAALVHSRLFDVAMAIQMVTGALILIGVLVPVALCVVMPISTCALYWSVILDHQPAGAVLALVAFALNGLLMLAYIDYYKGALQRYALALGESGRSSFDSMFVSPKGRASRGQFVPALITLVAVILFYAFLVTGRTAQWCLLMLLFPGVILHARRLHDMGHSAWLLAVPAVLMVAAFAIWLHILSLGTQLDAAVPVVALVVSAGFALWGCIGRGQVEANRFGAPVTV